MTTVTHQILGWPILDWSDSGLLGFLVGPIWDHGQFLSRVGRSMYGASVSVAHVSPCVGILGCGDTVHSIVVLHRIMVYVPTTSL